MNQRKAFKKAFREAFGRALREQRVAKRLSQDALAYDAGLDRTYISVIELGTKSPTLDTIFTLCRALNCSFTALAQRTDEILATLPSDD